MICAALRVCLAPGLEPYERLRGCTPRLDARWDGPGRSFIGGCSRFGGWTWWCVPGGIWGRSGLILLSVQAGRLRTDRRVLLLAAGRWVRWPTLRGGAGG